jgi:uncharacterized glyoxalase superfamily protein PhnB
MSEAATFRVESLVPVLHAHDVARAIAYYRDVLGFTVDFTWRDPPVYAGLTLGAAGLHLSSRGSPAPAAICIFCTGLDALFAKLSASGARVARPISTEPYGMREFEVTDIHGHRLIFCEPASPAQH